eukprot:g16491.t1
MSTFFLNRGFPSTVVDRVLNQVQHISRTSTLTPSLPSCNSNRVPLLPTYHPTSIHIQKIISCHFRQLQQDATTRYIYPSPPSSNFRRDHPLWDTLSHFSFNANTPDPQQHLSLPAPEIPHCSLANIPVSGLLQCSSEAQRKLEEQHLI